MGSEYKKPDATTLITRDNYKDLLWPLPTVELFTCGKKASEKLALSGIRTIGDLACADKALIRALLGENGAKLHEYANGEDTAPVALSYERSKIKSLGHGITFSRDLENEDDIRTAVTALSDKVSARLRRHMMKAGGIKVEIKDPAFHVISRQRQLPSPSDTAGTIRNASLAIIKDEWKTGDPIRLITITAINLVDESMPVQLDIFSSADPDADKHAQLDRAIDSIRGKYGDSSITFGKLIGNDIGIHISYDEED